MTARRGQPNLNNDPAYDPDWRERIMQSAPDESKKRVMFRTTDEFNMLLSRAARRRGMTNSFYMRRAISAFIAEDLQIPFEDICQLSPGADATLYTGRGRIWPRDDGNGYGKWEVKS